MSRRVNLGVQKGIPALRFLQKGADSGVFPLKNGKRAGSLRFRLQESAQAYIKCEIIKIENSTQLVRTCLY